jgi:glycine/D-amino acid oxidase-like deaminating enzyme
MTDVIIIGGGFAGIYAAWDLARRGKEICLIEGSTGIGGALKSRDWQGYRLDMGTHNLDIRTAAGETFYLDILGEAAEISEDYNWASTTGTHWTKGFEMPDWSEDTSLTQTALIEMARIEEPSSARDYPSWVLETYGPTLGARILEAVQKVTGSPADGLAVEARDTLGLFTRPKLGSDGEMIALKESAPFWDDRLGVSLASGDPRFAGASRQLRFAYPKSGGLQGFCNAATRRLQDLGVTILTETPVTGIEQTGSEIRVKAGDAEHAAPSAFWSLPDVGLGQILGLETDIRPAGLPVGVACFAYEVDVEDILGPDYLHDFAPHRPAFRYNKAGIYGNQIQGNKSFVMAEVPAHPKDLANIQSDAMADQVWEGFLETGFLKDSAKASAATHFGLPVAYAVPRLGWEALFTAFRAEAAARVPGLSLIDFGARGRAQFMRYYDEMLRDELENAHGA